MKSLNAFYVSKTKPGVILPLIAFGLIIASGCVQSGQIATESTPPPQLKTVPPVKTADPVSAPNSEAPAAPRLKDMSKSVEITASSKVDTLIVIDNSLSMGFEQKNMADRFTTFIDELSQLDWQLAITTTDVSADEDLKDGRLIKFSGFKNTSILNSKMNPDTVKDSFAKTIQRTETGNKNEQGIKATYRALERSQDLTTIDDANRKLIRSDAALAVIVVSDADETPLVSKKGKSLATVKNTPKGLLDFINKTWNGTKNISFHSIVVKDGDKECLDKDRNEDYGLSYIQLSKLTNGLIGSVCEQDYGSQLKIIGQKVQTLIKTIRLDCAPADTNGDGVEDIQLKNLDGKMMPGYHVDGLDVIFDEQLPMGTNTIDYKCIVK